jgi:hypothetical protein
VLEADAAFDTVSACERLEMVFLNETSPDVRPLYNPKAAVRVVVF